MTKTTKRASIGGGIVIVAAAAMGILNQNPDDVRLPPEMVVAVYADKSCDAFYATEFVTVLDTMRTRKPATFFAVPKDALEKQSFRDIMYERAKAKGGSASDILQMLDMRRLGYPDSVWVLTWSVSQVIDEGERLDPALAYEGRFGLQEAP